MQEHFFQTLANFGERPCLVDGRSGETLSYTEVARRADSLLACDPSTAGRLAFLSMHNDPASIIAYLALLRGGFAVHLLDPDKLEANARLIEQYRPGLLVDMAAPEPVTQRDGNRAVHEDICILLSTSGSTGSAKFVKLTYGNIEANTRSICEYLELGEDDCGITALRGFYSYGMSVINTHLAAGAALVVGDYTVDSPDLWDAIGRFGVTNLAGVPFTFEVMKQQRRDLSAYPSLAFLTQAGGKLSSELVSHFAQLCAQADKRFYVMYGQTEAAPRMSYLPPAMAQDHPASIGCAIPGGTLSLRDAQGREITQAGVTGELVYSGPNVMAGYAMGAADLAKLEHIPSLLTGDLARFDDDGLFYIEGRSSRFLKPVGKRVSLDALEDQLRAEFASVVATGNDSQIVIALEDKLDEARKAEVIASLSSSVGLPSTFFTLIDGEPVPRLPSGKVDYQAIMASISGAGGSFNPLLTFWDEFVGILIGRKDEVQSVLDAFQSVLGSRANNPSATFRSLGGDSLSFMQLQLSLEDYLGDLPQDWPNMSILELEAVKSSQSV